MYLPRKQDLSVYYFLEEILPDFVTVVDGFPSEELVIPTVSVERLSITGQPFELGGLEKDKAHWRIDVFGKNKSQRDDFAYLIYGYLEGNVPVYDYDEGFPPSVSPTKIGVLKCYNRIITVVHMFKDLVRDNYWRSAINFSTEYETL